MLARSLSLAVAAALVAPALLPSAALASDQGYSLVGSFALPDGAWDVGPDGRILQIRGSDIYQQTAIDSSTYTRVGSVTPGTISAFGASFLRVSPDGSRIAIGDNNFNASASVAIVSSASLNTAAASISTLINCPNFDAAWSGNNTLYVTGAGTDFVPVVNQLSLAGSPTRQTVVAGAGGASAGVVIANGSLYTGVGFAGGGLPTGQIRSFALAALGSSSAVPFTSGMVFTTALSASPLAVDAFGNLIAGGGDGFSGTSDIGYADVIDLADPTHTLHLSPAGTGTLYSVAFNSTTDELLVVADGTAYRYAIPAPASAVVMVAAMPWAYRRRRSAR